MPFKTIISVSELSIHLEDPHWLVVDCRFKLADTRYGLREYELAHIPGAVYAHLDDDLSGPIIQGVTGRHPLPSVEKITGVFSRLGIDSSMQVVAYDDISGALAAGRLWWLLHWLGHEAVAVLDGGWQMWLKNELPTRQGHEEHPRGNFIPHPRDELIAVAEQVDTIRKDSRFRLLDARTADRYRGQNETIDPIAGHIPGALSAPYTENLNPDGTFRDQKELKERYEKLVAGVPGDRIVTYCGSGVTATSDILAMMLAGMGDTRLYAGSYSEWITDPHHPVQK